MPVSTLISDYYGIDDVCLSIPSVVNKVGIEKVLRLELSPDEQKQIQYSAETLKGIIKGVRL